MILQRLRLETQAQHTQLDQHPLMKELMSPAVSRAVYATILSKFLGFYQPLEMRLAQFGHWSGLDIDFDQRRKTPWLMQDLSRLDLSPSTIPQSPTPDWIEDEAAALGTFYVLEGSTLGGQLIARHVTKQLDLSPDHGLAFFSSYGDAVGPRWKETRQALLLFSEQSGSDEAMITAAKKTFLTLAAWLDSPG